MHTIEKEWKREILSGEGTEESPHVFGDILPINLGLLEAALKAAHSEYVGNSAGAKLSLHFSEKPSDAKLAELEALWAAMDAPEHTLRQYVSAEQEQAAKDALKASAVSKLAALGLSAQEISAILA